MMSFLSNTIFWNVFDFLVLIYLLQRFLYKPLIKIIDERRAKIESDLKEAAEDKKKAAQLMELYQSKIEAARKEGEKIIAQAEKRANERREEIIAEAHREATRIKERAMEEIKLAKHQALSQLRDEVSNISLLIAQKFIQKSVDKKLHQNLVEEFIDQLDDDKLGGSPC